MSDIRPYKDLSDHYFYPDDKKYVCQHIEENKLTIRRFATGHKLSKSRIGKWMKKWKLFKETGRDQFSEDKAGRPPKIDIHGTIELCRLIKAGRRDQDAVTSAQVSTKIKSEIIAIAGRKGIANDDGKFSRTTE